MANIPVRKIRDVLVTLAAVLMVAIVVFQCLEISKFELMPVITSRLSELFASDAPAAPAAPADAAPADLGPAPAPAMGPDMAPPPGPPARGL